MSETTELIPLLQKIPIFRDMNEVECRQLAEIAQIRSFAAGEVIIRQNETFQNLWIVLEGKCDVVKYREETNKPSEATVLAVLEPHAHFGEMSFFHPAPHSANVRARSDVRLLQIIRTDYDKLINDGIAGAYKLAYNAVQSLADRLRRMDEWVAELSADNPPDRKVPEWSSFRDKLFTGWNL